MSLQSRFIQVDRVTDRMTEAQVKEITKAYKASLGNIRADLGKIYAKYEKDGVLSYAEMTKYNRLSNLFDEVGGELKTLTGHNAKLTKQLAGDVYHENFFRTAFTIETTAEAKLGFGMLNPKTIEASVQNPLSGLTLNERLTKNRQNVIIKAREQITQGLIQGESYKKMADRIKEVLEKDAAGALRVARTEAHRNAQAGRLASFEHAEAKGVEIEKVWSSAVDGRTRDTHAAMDGQTVGQQEDFESPSGATGPAPGMLGDAAEDINCRCSVRAQIKGYSPELRRIRGEGVVPYQNFSEWAEAKGIPMKYKGAEPRVAGWRPFMSEKEAAGWAKDSVVQKTVYHGTSEGAAKSIMSEGFKIEPQHDRRLFGDGAYFIADKKSADNWAGVVSKEGESIPVRINLKNPAVVGYDGSDSWRKLRSDAMDAFSDKDRMFDSTKITAYLQKKGHDGIIAQEWGKEIFVVFDKKSIVVVK
jgi:SPP1 gp7 family putative phage head morphogenesis protein